MTKIEDIEKIIKAPDNHGFLIVFNDGREIHVTKRRTIPALLILIKYGDGSEADLQAGSERLPAIKEILKGKIPDDLIKNSYADANKPFSELWNEEGFVWITNKVGERRLGSRSQRYVLNPEDHNKFFLASARKANRTPLKENDKESIREKQNHVCNICHSKIFSNSKLKQNIFSRDRVREVFDHRIPVEKGGNSESNNYQALCFYCNKSKWQICTTCELETCTGCVLAYPEISTVIAPTNEDISDRM